METQIVTSVLDGLPADCRRQVEGFARAIDKARAKATAEIFEIGEKMQAARAALANHKNGLFGRWVVERCGMTRKSAENYISVFEAFGGEKYCERLSQYATAEALYLLARDSTPEAAIGVAVEATEAGERITLKRAKAIIADASKVVDEEKDLEGEAGAEAEDEADELPDYVKRLQPYESLTEAIEALNTAVAAIYLRWPQEYIVALSDRLQSLSEELQEKGTLRC